MKKHIRTAAYLAALYQLFILVHIALLLFFPSVNPSFMISLEGLLALGWFGWCFHKGLHEFTGKAPFAGALGVVYAVLRFSSDLLNNLDLSLNLQATLQLLITAETAFLGMLSILLIAHHNLPYEGPEL